MSAGIDARMGRAHAIARTNPDEALVSRANAEAFARDGVTVLRGAFGEWVERLREGVEKNLRSPGPHVRHYTPDGQPGRFFGDYCNWQRIDEYEDFVRRSALGAVGAALMPAAVVRFFHEHVLVKEPGTEQPTPWHHDQPYYPVDGKLNASLWIPLDTVPAATCPEFIAGSHLWGKWFVPTRFTGQEWDRDSGRENVERIPDIEADRGAYDIRRYDLEPGDAIAFNFLTVHGAPPNRSASNRRRGFSARLLGDDATWAVRSGPTSPPYPELSARLRHGDRLDDVDEFPVIYQAD
ncbi:MAG: phytanoyl-CoA dioxygenase family protein [Gammaproteobacteria bacterium]